MFHLFIATPEEVIFDGKGTDLIVPGSAGYFEVLTNHAPLISTLIPGRLEFLDETGNKTTRQVTGGLVQVDHNEVAVLLD